VLIIVILAYILPLTVIPSFKHSFKFNQLIHTAINYQDKKQSRSSIDFLLCGLRVNDISSANIVLLGEQWRWYMAISGKCSWDLVGRFRFSFVGPDGLMKTLRKLPVLWLASCEPSALQAICLCLT